MKFDKLIKQPASWMVSSPDESDIVLTSRIRLARNLKDAPFPGWAKKEERIRIFAQTMPVVKSLPSMKNGYASELSAMTQLERQILVERHLISRDLAARSEGCGVVISKNNSLSILLNEEDHLRLQFILPGQQLKKAWASLNRVDNALEEGLPYAFNEMLGYLTACPTNLGTGMRASAMLHLPGLMLSGFMEQVIKAAHDLDLTVRGIYGEGTQALGNLFQISNQMTLGEREEDVIDKLKRVIADITRQERNARENLYVRNQITLADRIARAYGILKYSVSISNKEAMEYISLLRLGASLGFFESSVIADFNQLILNIQNAHLQYAGSKDSPVVPGAEHNDIRRADVIRSRFETIPEPKIAAN